MLREKKRDFEWRTMTLVLSKCSICKRFNFKNLEYFPVSWPENLIKGAALF